MSFSVNVHLKVGLSQRYARAAGASAPTSHLARFLDVYDQLQTYLLDTACTKHEVDPNRRKYLKAMMDTTVLGGKYNRGLCVVDVVDELSKEHSAEVREDELFCACICGWVIEFLQAHFLVEDDIMDSSITRRGKPCWYRHPGVTTQCAINDGLIVMAWASQIVLHYLDKKPYLIEVLRLLHHTDYQTTIGQLYDVTSMFDSSCLDPNVAQPTTTDYKEFTLTHYKRIVKFKTAYYTYYAPLIFGEVITQQGGSAGVDRSLVERVAMLMGEYFQVQDDVLDCFADPAVLGKIGTDIEDTKCSWLAVTFVATATPAQLDAFKQNYGKHEAACVAAIKKLYADANLLAKFDAYEVDTLNEVQRLLGLIGAQNDALGAAIDKLWQKTYKRSK